jgi:hypothetical protein
MRKQGICLKRATGTAKSLAAAAVAPHPPHPTQTLLLAFHLSLLQVIALLVRAILI